MPRCTVTMSTCNGSGLTWTIYSEIGNISYSELSDDLTKVDEDLAKT